MNIKAVYFKQFLLYRVKLSRQQKNARYPARCLLVEYLFPLLDFSIDNSAWSRNGDFRPTRLDSQLDTSILELLRFDL